MQGTHISGLDLKLLPALDALLRHRNVTRAAHEVHLSQPAMSRVLARLRELQGDPLLVRSGAGYVLTARATALQPKVAAAMRELRDVLRPHAFDPAQEQRNVRFAATDAQSSLLLAPLAARLAVEAPGVTLRVESYRADTLERLVAGDIDLVFALDSTQLPPATHSELVGTDRVVLVLRAAHPAAKKRWTLADYAKYPHVGIALAGDGLSEIDTQLAAKGITRRMAFVTPYFMTALTAVSVSDAVTTLSQQFTSAHAAALKLVMKPPPLGDTVLNTTLVCSAVRANDPLLAWLRALVREIAAGRKMTRAARAMATRG